MIHFDIESFEKHFEQCQQIIRRIEHLKRRWSKQSSVSFLSSLKTLMKSQRIKEKRQNQILV